MNENKLVIIMWAALVLFGSIFIAESYYTWRQYSEQCKDASGTLFHDRTDYICIKTKAVIPLK
jgi:hypothetical protein